MKRMQVLFLGLVCLGSCRGKGGTPVYEWTQVSRGTIEKTVSSTGTLTPVAIVKVLPRMSGKVEKVLVDYNDVVRQGDILAELNTDMLRLQRDQKNAQVTKARANYELQKMDYDSQVKLSEKNLISAYDLKNSKTTLDMRAAELSTAEAELKTIDTEINQYAFITSPIDGIVLQRNINVGDTVVDSSSSNSSTIFTIAENLEEMQIESWVGELDIASIKKDQGVRFTLESLPGRTYTGVVSDKRLMPSTQDSVVSYQVIINVNNKDGSLLPGMTCSVEFIEERDENVLLVANGALRYSPTTLTAEEIAGLVFTAGLAGLSEEERAAAVQRREAAQKTAPEGAAPGNAGRTSAGGLAGMLAPGTGGRMRPPGGAGASGPGSSAGNAGGTGRASPRAEPKPLWYLDGNGKLACVLVRPSLSNGTSTEIRPAGPGSVENSSLEGMRVILREKVQ